LEKEGSHVLAQSLPLTLTVPSNFDFPGFSALVLQVLGVAPDEARRLAQRGVTVNALVRAYRLGHKVVLDAVLDEIRVSNLEPPLSLAVFSQISEVTFGYIDWITQQVVSTYQSEHDRWMENQNQTWARAPIVTFRSYREFGEKVITRV
jgi:hypothetical protein